MGKNATFPEKKKGKKVPARVPKKRKKKTDGSIIFSYLINPPFIRRGFFFFF